MKVKEIRDMTADELRVKLDDLEKEFFELRKVKTTGKLENPLRLRTIRREVACVKTILNERK
ncbi:MAG: 50S ribosomal protein L29 [Lentisphaerae bacterium]|nr:50S ribosomal protein L29 [Lentisphaerota bacterium]